MGVISDTVDRLLHTTAAHAGRRPGGAALELHERSPVVDLVAGSALFRGSLAVSGGRGHVDLARLRAGGVNVVGLTIATRYPDLRGTLSRFHFRSLGAPRERLRTNMSLAEWLIARIHGWCASSPVELRLLRTPQDLDACLTAGGPLGVFIGVQGAHVLDGDVANVARLRELGVLMLAPAHVMDNPFVGSSTGARRTGLAARGRELIGELERQAMIVDLAHMSTTGIQQSLTICRRAPVISHAGLQSRAGAASRWRRYSPATRNVPDWAVRQVAQAGGLTGLVLSTQLLGGESIKDAVATLTLALELAGPSGVAIGSDMDGGLRMVIDAAGFPLLTDGLLTAGLDPPVVSQVLGQNAVRLLRSALSG